MLKWSKNWAKKAAETCVKFFRTSRMEMTQGTMDTTGPPMFGMKFARNVSKPQAAGTSRPMIASAIPLVMPIISEMNVFSFRYSSMDSNTPCMTGEKSRCTGENSRNRTKIVVSDTCVTV